MARHAPSLPIRSSFFFVFLIAVVVLLATSGAVLAQPGLDSPQPAAAFLNGAFPPTSPGLGDSLGWRVVPAFENLSFNDPLVFTALAGTDRIFVGSRDGYLESFVNHPLSSTKDLFLDLRATTAVVWDGGMLGLAFHPRFGQAAGKDYAYIYYCARPSGASYPTGFTNGHFGTFLRLSRFDVDPISHVANPASELIMFNVRLYNGSHRGGGMAFGLDGFLYLTIGDQFRYETAQDLSSVFEGGVVRLDVDMDPLESHAPRRSWPADGGEVDEHTGVGYWIPDDNPFQDVGGGLFEEFCTAGNRNPHRMSIDMANGRMWIGEIGQNSREEINVVEIGANYGWPFREGTIAGVRSEPPSYFGTLKEPVLDFLRSEANAIIGGHVYRGSEYPNLVGRYLCGDYGQARIWAVDYDELSGTGTKEYLCNFTPGALVTFGQDRDGEVYLCGLGQGVPIYKLEQRVLNGPAPALLSQTGAFTDLTTMEPSSALIPYELNVPFWSDGAVKSRWLSVPNNGSHDTAEEQIAYSEEGEWGFPEGTVLVKHFELPVDDTDPSVLRRTETRFLVSGDQGEHYGVSYKWLPDNSDAVLMEDGLDESIAIATAAGTRYQTWHYPSRSSCLSCHNSAAGFSLGLKTRQLNREAYYPVTGRSANQLVTLSSIGMLSPSVNEGDLSGLLTGAPVSDATAPVEHRVRSYLDANCSHCHRPGTGNRGQFDARMNIALDSQGLIYGGVSDDLGIPGAQVVLPQDLSRSLLYQRVDTRITGIGMPPIASNREDDLAVDLIGQWIAALDADFPTNVALGKPVSQSSTGWGGNPERANDGNNDGVYDNGSVSHTNNDVNSWWEIDLGQSYEIEEIVLWNRSDCCTSRLSNFHVLLSVDPFVSQNLATTQAQTGVLDLFTAGAAGRETRLSVAQAARYLRVQLGGQDYLSLAEVEVFASSWSGTPIERYVLGNGSSSDATHDGWSSNLVVNESDAYANLSGMVERVRVDDFAFYAWQQSDPVTPFVALRNADDDFTVMAIGSTRAPGEYGVGENIFLFDDIAPPIVDLMPGQSLVTGFLDASPDGSGGGAGSVIPFDQDAPADEIWVSGGSAGAASASVALGAPVMAGSSSFSDQPRNYRFSIQLTKMLDIVPAATPVDDGAVPSQRLALRLAEPVPNPFNPRVELRLELQQTTHVRWAVYDARGRMVVELGRGLMTAGEHVRVWSGSDDRGRQVASGVYYEHVSIPGAQQSKKMVLLK